ncbi:helix-turn-helix domain-containing protein [Gaetbulibacter sp. M235]|uniref:helix-turn-helix domain-containing protein n=1 Tax=Gaetbulibacter sp. M235 TaxID=3126510 RepID=UPI00374F2D9D
MSKAFINKIEQIILSNLENEKFGVSELAKEINLSRSQILRKIKSSIGKSANNYIREIRLREAVRLILNTELTASEISYKVGFRSPSYFNKCFLDYYNQTPGEFKKTHEDDRTFDFSLVEQPEQKKTKKKWVLISTILLIAILATGLYNKNKDANNKVVKTSQPPNVSIAVLPIDDYSENRDYDYLASGITEAINLELSKNKSIRVISRGSCERFKDNNNLSYGEIAKELGVTLLLGGSVFPNNDSLLVVAQLIKPFPKEQHVWSNNYHHSTKNILQLVQNISSEIANEISTTLTSNVSGEKVYKINPEAYTLYLKGKHLWYTQKTQYKSLVNAKEYLEESIKIDPNFAPAYVTLTETYIALNKLLGDNNERISNRENARKTIDIAFGLDDALAEAYFTKGNLVGKFDWNWEKMKALTEKGLVLDPNNARGHQILSNYYTIKGNYQKAIEEALIAESLDPLNPATGCLVAERYYISRDFDQSIKEYNEVLELEPDYGFALNGIGYAYFQKGNLDETFHSWRKLQTIMQNDSLGTYYDNNGLEKGLFYYIDKAKLNTPGFCSNPAVISSIQMMVNENFDALQYIKIAYDNKNEDLPIMITYPDFYPLHKNAQFKELAHKMRIVFPN